MIAGLSNLTDKARVSARRSSLPTLEISHAADTEDVAAPNTGDVNAMIGWTDNLWP